MTNEELALQIQSGDRTLIPQLWAQVERFIRKMANRYADKVPGAEADDLYQTGFLAMLRAVDRYEEPHSFLSGLVFALKREYAELGGYLTSKRDPLIAAVSLDAPLSDEDDSTLQDCLLIRYRRMRARSRLSGTRRRGRHWMLHLTRSRSSAPKRYGRFILKAAPKLRSQHRAASVLRRSVSKRCAGCNIFAPVRNI